MGQLHHGLSGSDDLPGLGQGVDDGPIRVSEQRANIRPRFAPPRPGLQPPQLRFRAVGGRLDLIISLPETNPSGKLAIPRFVGPCLGSQCARRRDRVFLWRSARGRDPRVEAHERLAGADLLPDIDEALDHLARNAKAEIALHARHNNACECPLGGPAGFATAIWTSWDP